MSNTTRRIFTDTMGGTSRDEYIGTKGELFYDQDTGALYVSDGVTAGGTAVSSSNGSSAIIPNAGRILYVDKSRTDSYTQTGGLLTPFKTIQAALNAANANYTIMISPALTYKEDLVIPVKDSLVIMSSSTEVNVNIVNSSNSNHTISFTPSGTEGANVFEIEFRGLNVISTSNTKQAFYVDAIGVTATDGVCCGDKFKVVSCDFRGNGLNPSNPAVYIRNAGCFDWYDSRCIDGDLTVVDTSCFIFYGGRVGQSGSPSAINLSYDAGSGVTSSIPHKYYKICRAALLYGDMNVSGHPIIELDPTAAVQGNVVATALTSYYDGPTSKDLCPILNLRGQIGKDHGNTSGHVTITLPSPQTLGEAYNRVDLTGAKIAGNLTVSKASYLPADATRGFGWVSGGAVFDTTVGNAITVNGYVNLDLRQSQYSEPSLNVSSTGFVDRKTIRLPNTAIVTGGSSYNIAPALPVGSNYSVSATPNTNINVFVTTKADSYFTIDASANGFADVTLHRP